MTKDSMDSFDVWKTWSKLSCGFLRAVSKSPKSLERVIISAPKEKRSLLLRMFGTTIWWSVSVQLVRKWPGENGKLPKISKCYTNHSIRATAVTILDKSGFEARHIMANIKMKPASGAIAKLIFAQRRCQKPSLQDAKSVKSHRSWIHTSHLPFLASRKKK